MYILTFYEILLRMLHKLGKTDSSKFIMHVLRTVRLRSFVTIVYKLLFKLAQPFILLITTSFVHSSLGVGALSLVRSTASSMLLLARFLLAVLGVLRAGR